MMCTIPSQVRVCIIGAGVAGLGAAQKLIEAGVNDLIVLEAQDRIGGRVHTVLHGDYHLEFGAHWIHGEEGNVVHDWAAENNHTEDVMSLTQTGIGETMFVRSNGIIVPTEVIEEFQIIQGRIDEEDKSASNLSFGEFFLERFRKANKWGVLGEELADWQGRFQNCIDGTESWFEASAKGHSSYVECPGNPVVNWKEGGYQNLLTHLKKKILPSQLLLNVPVKCIDWNIQLSNSSKGCHVVLESGEVIQAGHVIFTPSLAVLKAYAKDLFNPPLPSYKMNAIKGLGIGCVDKIYLKFPNQWWPDGCDGFSFLRDLNCSPSSITKDNWEWGFVGFYEVVKQPNMLCGWICGEAARLMEQTDEESVSRRCIGVLRKYLSSRFEVPDAIWCKRSTWGANPWTKGSYSFRSMVTEAMGVCAADLAQPIVEPVNNIPVLCFAGEATHESYYSTVHGALESGWREAERLVDYFRSVEELSQVDRVMSRSKNRYEVIVIGCGAAGVGAARELTSHGINNVLILEGSDRVGGRINTIQTDPSHHVDLGAQWVHGEVGNAVYKFASSRNLLYDFLSEDGEGTFYTKNGQIIPESLVDEVKGFLDGVDDEMKEMSNADTLLSVGDFFRKRFDEYISSCKQDGPELKQLKKSMFEWYIKWQRVDNACNELESLSAHCWGRYIFCEGNENMNPKHGYSKIFDAILQETNADVVLSSEVTCIDYASNLKRLGRRFVRSDGLTSPVIVKCKNGEEYEANHVVVTPSIGYLKRHLTMFSPKLPDSLQETIISTGFGTIDKIFLEFEEPFWPEDCKGIHLVWADQPPIYERVDISDCWFQGITGFDPVVHQKAVLCGWIGGAEAEFMEKLPVMEVGRKCVDVLRQFLGREDIPYPKKVYRSQWANNSLICGSYSYHTVPCNCRMGISGGNALNLPVHASTDCGDKVPVLVLAGEANSTKYYSTVHGAMQNGMSQVSHYLQSLSRISNNASAFKSKM